MPNAAQEMHLLKVPVMYRSTMVKAFDMKASPRTAIKAMCLSCSGYQRAEITNCQVQLCPLHQYRPYQENPPLLRARKHNPEANDA